MGYAVDCIENACVRRQPILHVPSFEEVEMCQTLPRSLWKKYVSKLEMGSGASEA